MTIEDCIKKLMKIDSLQIATVDKNESPQIRVISARIFNNTTMYFLTAKGKSFVKEMENNRNIAIIGFDEKENDMVRITGIVEKVSEDEQLKWRNKIYETYPYLENVYPNETKNINVIYKIERTFFIKYVKNIFIIYSIYQFNIYIFIICNHPFQSPRLYLW